MVTLIAKGVIRFNSTQSLLILLSLRYGDPMDGERVIERTVVNGRAIVTTMEVLRPGMIVGIHPTLETTVSGVDGIDSTRPWRMYINNNAAAIGHEVVVEEIGRMLVELRAIARGISPTLVEGAL